MSEKLKPCPRSEFVSDWIVEVAEKDNGALFMKCTKDENLAPVTYGDLRKLMVEDYIHNTRPIEDRQRELMKEAANLLTSSIPALRSRAQMEQYHGSKSKADKYHYLAEFATDLIKRLEASDG